MMKKAYLLILIFFLAGCIYETPEAKQVSQKSINTTKDIFAVINDSGVEIIQEFKFQTNPPNSYLIKGVENYYDECDGCIDFISAAASSMNKINDKLSYSYVVSTSGAVRLEGRHKTFETFFTDRLRNYGFSVYYAGSPEKSKELSNLFSRNNINPGVLNGDAHLFYIKSLLYSQVIPIVSLDRYYLFEEQSVRYNTQSKLLAQEHKEIFVNVVGYDKNIKINDPTFSGFKSRYQEIELLCFLSYFRLCR